MGVIPALVLAVLIPACTLIVYAEQGTYVDGVEFIQYLDENTVLEEIRNGNLDLYYYRVPADRIEEAGDGIRVFGSAGGSYSLLVNPAESEKFNPFSIREARYALNYLVDRKLIVNELVGGFGTIMVSNYGPLDPDYLAILGQAESLGFEYNPSLAGEMISGAMSDAGAEMSGGYWYKDGSPVELRIFIRSDDQVRKSIGELVASELEELGFEVRRDYGDLNKAFVVVYGSDPAELEWSLYTEGWAGRSAFVRYDQFGLAQMYSPWASNMPGFNDPSYWNYENDLLDTLTQKIYSGEFGSAAERDELIRDATREGVNESVRIFLAGTINQYVAGEDIEGIVNDLGAGVPSRFTPINARTDSDSLLVGVKHIYQGAWNPVMGLTDTYSTYIWNVLHDPAVFKHPYTGQSIPIRADWEVETAGSRSNLVVGDGVITWDPAAQQWADVSPEARATSKVTFDLIFSDWHHGIPMDINDILYSVYFAQEWGSAPLEGDMTFDAEYTPRATQLVDALVGIKPVDGDTIEVYLNYWHFDEGEIAQRASVWSTVPWEVHAAMEEAVMDGKASFSRSGAASKGVGWLSLVVERDAVMLADIIKSAIESGKMPAALARFEPEDGQLRHQTAVDWIESNGHAVISNGPFYLDRYSPESRIIRINAFADDSYPFERGTWGDFEGVSFPKITAAHVPDVVGRGEPLTVRVEAVDSSSLHYFFSDHTGVRVASGIRDVSDGSTLLQLTGEQTRLFGEGANDLKLFAVSDGVLRPDFYSAGFFASDSALSLPDVSGGGTIDTDERGSDWRVIAAALLAVAAVAIILWRVALVWFR